VIFELRFLPYLWERPDGKPHRSDDVSIFPYSELGKNLKLIDHWWTSGRAAERSGLKQAGKEASRYSEGSGRKDTSSGWMMLVCLASGQDEHVVRTDGTVDKWTSGRLTGNLKSSIFFAVQSLLKMLWQEESLFTTSLHISDFVQTQNEAKILTWLIHPDGYSSCPDDHFFATSTWHYVWTSLKFRPDGEPYRVISLSPRATAHFLASFCVFFVVLCIFLILFMHSSRVHVLSLDFISTQGIFLLFYYLILSFLA